MPSVDQEDKENHQPNHLNEFLIHTWRSIDTIRTQRDQNPQSQLFELSNQINLLLENHQIHQANQDEDDFQTRQKISDLFTNLEAKHLKVSEYNKQLLQDLFSQTSQLVKTQTLKGTTLLNCSNSALGNFLGTLNQIVKEEENSLENEVSQKDLLIKDLQNRLNDSEKVQQSKDHKIKELEMELKFLEKENSKMQKSIERMIEKDSKQVIFETKNNSDYIRLIELMSIERFIEMDEEFSKIIEKIDKKCQESLLKFSKQLQDREISKRKTSENTNKHNTLEIFKQQLKRSSSFELTKGVRDIQEPTPRFFFDNNHELCNQLDQTNQSQVILTTNSVFQQNLSLNRSLQGGNHSRLFNSTLNNLFRKRPCQADQTSELWTYIFELESELIDMQKQIKQQADESQLEISVCLGNQEGVKMAKASLENQIEELNIENQMKTLKIGQLEKFNQKLMHTMNESKDSEKDSSFMKNLRGIISPKQYQKVKKFIQEEFQNLNNLGDVQQFDDQNISIIEPERQNDVSLLFDNDQSYFMKEARVINNDSKSSTMSFRQQLQIDPNSFQQNISKIPLTPSTFYNGFNQNSTKQAYGKKQNVNFMLIQDQMNSSADYGSLNNSAMLEPQFQLHQQQLPSIIMDNYSNCLADQSLLINTHNNRTLHNLLKMERTNGTMNSVSQSSGNGTQGTKGLFGFKNRLQMQRANQSRILGQTAQSNFNGGQSQKLVNQIHENFQNQLQELKDEKLKLIQILNKFLNLPTSPNETSVLTIEDYLQNNTSNLDQSILPPNKQFFEDFRLQITQALTQQQLDLQSYQEQQKKLQDDRQDLQNQKQRMEQKRLDFNDKVKKLKEKNEDLAKKISLMDEREKLLDQTEQKLRYRKQALDDEWSRLDKQRSDLAQQQIQLNKEWERLTVENRDLDSVRQQIKLKGQSVKECKAKVETEKRYIENERVKIEKASQEIEAREKLMKTRERNVEREADRIKRLRDEINQDKLEVEKQKEFIRGERSLMDQERHEMEGKRTLSGMFIPDIKQLVSKMSTKGKSLNRTYINEGQEDRIKQQYSSAQTNMSAYINKCQCSQSNDGIFNCDLHKTMNKSTLSLSNIAAFQTNAASLSAIGSGRPTYKLPKENSKLTITKSFLRENSFKRIEAASSNKHSLNNLSLSFMFPQSTKHEKDNFGGLESILKGTAKFKESQNRLEQSYNSLLESTSNNNKFNETMQSFASFEERTPDKRGEDSNEKVMSRDEL